VNACRYLIRLFSGGIAIWLEDSPNIEVLAKVFKLADEAHSVYEVADGEEEWLAASAHALTNPKNNPDAVSLVRMHKGDLSGFGINVDETRLGITGIPRWDLRHRNILANRNQLLELVRFLANRCHRGHDLVRRIEKKFVLRSLHAVCSCASSQCPNHVKAIADWFQTGDKAIPPNLTLHQIKQELMAVEFEDGAIRPGAYALSSGDGVGDWFNSLNGLRQYYASHYITAIAKRFKLG
jgi:hypothetical protein